MSGESSRMQKKVESSGSTFLHLLYSCATIFMRTVQRYICERKIRLVIPEMLIAKILLKGSARENKSSMEAVSSSFFEVYSSKNEEETASTFYICTTLSSSYGWYRTICTAIILETLFTEKTHHE